MQDISLNELKTWKENILNQLKFTGCVLLMVSTQILIAFIRSPDINGKMKNPFNYLTGQSLINSP